MSMSSGSLITSTSASATSSSTTPATTRPSSCGCTAPRSCRGCASGSERDGARIRLGGHHPGQAHGDRQVAAGDPRCRPGDPRPRDRARHDCGSGRLPGGGAGARRDRRRSARRAGLRHPRAAVRARRTTAPAPPAGSTRRSRSVRAERERGCRARRSSETSPRCDAEDLEAALVSASAVDRAVVADAEGTGTTLVTAGRGIALETSFGAGSFARHVALGCVPLAIADSSTLRRDVDTAEQLDAAAGARSGSAHRARARGSDQQVDARRPR